jgi:hypothetical protein
MDCQNCPLYGKMEEWATELAHLKNGRLEIDALLRQGRYRLVNQVIEALHAADPECDLDGAADLEEEGFAPPPPPAGATAAADPPLRLPRGRKPGKILKFAGKQGCLF